MPCLQPRKTPFAFTSSVRSHTDSSVAIASSSLACMMPALLNSTFSRPNSRSAAATIFSQSLALATSALHAAALPPFFRTSATVSAAAFSFTSTARIAAPSREKRSADCRPMPLPAPVIRATLSFSLICPLVRRQNQGQTTFFFFVVCPRCGKTWSVPDFGSDPLEVSPAFPVGDRAVEGGRLGAVEMAVVLDDLLPEGALGEFTRFECVDGLGKGVRHARQRLGCVDVALEAGGRLDPVRDAVEARGECRGEGEVGVAVGARDAAFDAHARAFADHAEAGGAVVVAPGEAGRRPGGV